MHRFIEPHQSREAIIPSDIHGGGIPGLLGTEMIQHLSGRGR